MTPENYLSDPKQRNIAYLIVTFYFAYFQENEDLKK